MSPTQPQLAFADASLYKKVLADAAQGKPVDPDLLKAATAWALTQIPPSQGPQAPPPR